MKTWRRWHPWELEQLAELSGKPPGHGAWEALARKLGRPRHAVIAQARYRGHARATRHHWTIEEDLWLESRWETATPARILARFPGVSWGAIYKRAQRLRLVGRDNDTVSLNQAARKVGVARHTLRKMLRAHNPRALFTTNSDEQRPQFKHWRVSLSAARAALAAWDATETVRACALRHDIDPQTLAYRLKVARVLVPEPGHRGPYRLPSAVMERYARIPVQKRAAKGAPKP